MVIYVSSNLIPVNLLSKNFSIFSSKALFSLSTSFDQKYVPQFRNIKLRPENLIDIEKVGGNDAFRKRPVTEKF